MVYTYRLNWIRRSSREDYNVSNVINNENTYFFTDIFNVFSLSSRYTHTAKKPRIFWYCCISRHKFPRLRADGLLINFQFHLKVFKRNSWHARVTRKFWQVQQHVWPRMLILIFRQYPALRGVTLPHPTPLPALRHPASIPHHPITGFWHVYQLSDTANKCIAAQFISTIANYIYLHRGRPTYIL